MTSDDTRFTIARRAITALLVFAVVLGVAALGVSALPGALDPKDQSAPAAGSAKSAHLTPTPVDSAVIGPTIPDPSAGDFVRSTPSPVGPRTTTEVQQASAVSTALPSSAPVPPLLSTAPATASLVGGLVAGFPGTIHLPKDSKVVDSSVSSSGTKSQVTLAATTTIPASDVLSFYTTEFAALSLVAVDSPSVSGSTALAFSGGPNALTLTVTPTKSGASYSLFGVFETAG